MTYLLVFDFDFFLQMKKIKVKINAVMMNTINTMATATVDTAAIISSIEIGLYKNYGYSRKRSSCYAIEP